jgi:hypothetical protein
MSGEFQRRSIILMAYKPEIKHRESFRNDMSYETQLHGVE